MEVGDGAEGKRPPEGWKKTPESAGEKPAKRMMKSPYQLEILEKTYAVETYPSEALRAELSVKTGLTDRQLQMWFCHRRLKDRKYPPVKRSRREEASSPPPPPPELAMQQAGVDMMLGSASGSGSSPSPSHLPDPRKGAAARAAAARIGAEMSGAVVRKRYYESAPVIAPPVPPLSVLEMRVIASVESQLGERLREDGPILGVEFDPLPPDAFGAPIESDAPAGLAHRHPATHHFLDRLENSGQQNRHVRPYDGKILERHDKKSIKASTFLHTAEPSFIPNSSSGKKKLAAGGTHLIHSQSGSRALHEYQFLPEEPSARADERISQSHYYDSSVDIPNSRASSLASGGQSMRGNELVAPSYTFQGQISGSSLLPQQGRQQMFTSGSTEYDNSPHHNSNTNPALDGQYGTRLVAGIENSYLLSERRTSHDEDASRMDRKRKSDEARIAKEVEAHEKRIRKELEKQDILRRKREEQMRREMERHDRERRKEEERMMREKQREEERFLREQRRENERREKILMKESLRAEKLRQKEEMRREKEAARLKAANERATARRIAREYTELVEDERLELMELAASSKGLPSIMALDFDTLQRLDEFRDMLNTFPPLSVCLRRPFVVKPWTDSEENIGNLLMAWKFLITFADVLKLWPFTLDEFVQALHDYDSRLLGEIHVALLKSIIKDVEDVARTPSISLGSNQNSAANPGGGHPRMVEGAYSWGFDIRCWQRHLNFMTWPEILRQFALSAGFGPKVKKRNLDRTYFRDDNEGNDGEDIITNLRNGAAAENAVALMQEKGFTHRRRSRHRLTPGTVKFAAFHVLSLEGCKGLTILEVADKIQKSGLRDLTTSKTPEASIAAALSRDTKLFERTAPSTYCVRTPYRKDPVDADAILSAAREKIQVFQNVLSDSEEAEKDAEDAEREDDSECDGEDDAEVDDTGTEVEPNKNFLFSNELKDTKANQPLNNVKREAFCDAVNPQRRLRDVQKHPSERPKDLSESGALNGQSLYANSNCHEVSNYDQEDIEVDESNCEPWVQGLTEDEYCDLSVEERLNALVALIGVAIEGNSIRAILEERLEAASALKKQMWAEAQLDKRRMREEFTGKYPYSSAVGYKAEACQMNATTEGSPLHGVSNKGSDGNLDVLNNDQFLDPHNLCNGNMSTEKNLLGPEFLTNTDTMAPQQYGYAAEKSRAQMKAYIGHKAEEMYVYRSLPLGQDRRRNRYWLFSTSVSRNDPGSGRIFFESRDGFWKLIDSEEAFDALLASLDIRGLRESHLHSMLQKIEKAFKETIQRRKDCVDSVKLIGSLGKSGATEVSSRSDCGRELGSPSSTLSGLNADPLEYSSSFRLDLGRSEDERNSALKRYQGFLRWMWQESYNPYTLYAMKYGKKRCSELLQTCQSCYQSYFAEERHCSSCHKTFKILHNADSNFSEHVVLCGEKRRKDPDWKIFLSDSTSIRIRLLKAQLSLIEVSIPVEALQPFWTEGYRKSWGMKLHSSSSAEELFQVLTLLEAAIKHDFLSSSFETTKELLSGVPSLAAKNSVSFSGPAPVLPWVPDTTAAVALRLLDFDASVAYLLEQKLGFHKDKEAAEFVKFPSRYTVAKNMQELDPKCTQDLIDYQEEGMWLDNINGRRGRGRGIRSSRPTARGRGRGRGLRGVGSSTRIEFKVRGTLGTYMKTARKNTRRGGKARGARGRQRGRRTPRPRQRPESRIPIVKLKLSDHFNTGTSSMKRDKLVVEPQVSISRERWGLGGGKRGGYLEEAEGNSVGSESEDQVQPSEDEEYDDQAMDFTQDYNRSEPTGLMDDESEEDGDGEGDGEEEAEDDDDVDGVQGQEEMDYVEDEEMGVEYGEEVGDDDVNAEEDDDDDDDDDDEAQLSFSSDYSS